MEGGLHTANYKLTESKKKQPLIYCRVEKQNKKQEP
jgi:hypothetical protein